jgi:hypothetical protein
VTLKSVSKEVCLFIQVYWIINIVKTSRKLETMKNVFSDSSQMVCTRYIKEHTLATPKCMSLFILIAMYWQSHTAHYLERSTENIVLK